jgi:hypothetical protein
MEGARQQYNRLERLQRLAQFCQVMTGIDLELSWERHSTDRESGKFERLFEWEILCYYRYYANGISRFGVSPGSLGKHGEHQQQQ